MKPAFRNSPSLAAVLNCAMVVPSFLPGNGIYRVLVRDRETVQTATPMLSSTGPLAHRMHVPISNLSSHYI